MITRKTKIINWVIFLLLVLFALIYLVPVIMMVLGSFKTQAEASAFDLSLPSEFHPENYLHVLEKGKILNGYKNSLLITVPATLFSIIFGALAGIVLSRRRTRLSTGVYYYFIFGLTITLQIATTFAMLKVLNIYGTYLAVICLFIALRLPFTVMTFYSFTKSVPREIDEAATIDGCGFLRLSFQILLPVMKPILVTNIVVSAIDIWNNFMIPLFFFGSSKNWTVPLTIYNFFGQYQRDWQYVFGALVAHDPADADIVPVPAEIYRGRHGLSRGGAACKISLAHGQVPVGLLDTASL